MIHSKSQVKPVRRHREILNSRAERSISRIEAADKQARIDLSASFTATLASARN